MKSAKPEDYDDDNARERGFVRLDISDSDRPALTVATLRALLSRFPDAMPIRIEGCDCTAPAIGISVVDEGEHVAMIRRSDGAYFYDCEAILLP